MLYASNPRGTAARPRRLLRFSGCDLLVALGAGRALSYRCRRRPLVFGALVAASVAVCRGCLGATGAPSVRLVTDAIHRSALADVDRKLEAGTPLSFEDGVALYASPDIHSLGRMARNAKERKSGRKVFYVLNRYINSTNVCFAGCTFCSFAADDLKSRTGVPDDGRPSLRQSDGDRNNFNQIHIVGGHDPRQLSLDYWFR